MKTLRILSVAAFAALSMFTSANINAAGKEVDTMNKFSTLCFGDGITIEMMAGDTPSIQTSDNSVCYTIDAGVLTISHLGTGKTKVKICAPDIKSIQYTGDTYTKIYGKIVADDLLISASGKGDVNVSDANANNMVCVVLSDGDIRFANLTSKHIAKSIYGNGQVINAGKTL